jgi:3-methyl-2-oxobutanoate hydroxymethyltransferase
MPVTINKIREMKHKGEKIAMLTAYDYTTAQVIDNSGIPLILVGDSLGVVVLGYDSTLPVTMDDMLHHTKAVTRGVKEALVIGDMPFMSYHISIEETLNNAARFIQEGGAKAVKLEGGITVVDKVNRITDCGIPVMGHIGLTPQSIHQLGGHKIQGKTRETAARLIEDALALEDAGAFSIVIETVPAALAELITHKLTIPTIGIGAGKGCDGQVQVISDLLGSFTDFIPKHAKNYAKLSDITSKAISKYLKELQEGVFPADENSFVMDESILKGL